MTRRKVLAVTALLALGVLLKPVGAAEKAAAAPLDVTYYYLPG